MKLVRHVFCFRNCPGAVLWVVAVVILETVMLQLAVAQSTGKDKWSTELAALIKQAGKEGEFNLSWGNLTMGGPEGVRAFEKGFNKHYGTNIKFNYTPGRAFGAQAAKLAEEYAAGRQAFMDIALSGVGQTGFFTEKQFLLPLNLESLVPHVHKDALSKIVSRDKSLITFVSRVKTIVFNSKLVPKDSAPRSMQDLLDPKWKGKLATTPYASGFETLGHESSWGERRTIEYARALSRNLAGLMRCGEFERLTSGEFWIFAIECEPGTIQKQIDRGAPLAQLVPTDLLQIDHWWLGVPKNARNPSVAQLFISFLMTREGQIILFQQQGEDLHYLEGSRVAAEVKKVQKSVGREFDDLTIQRVVDQKNRDDIRTAIIKIFAQTK
jgi:ABC-type Fe3+ transport system substrate-binding protein